MKQIPYPNHYSAINKQTRKVIQLSIDENIPEEYDNPNLWEITQIPGVNIAGKYTNPLDKETPDLFEINVDNKIQKLSYQNMYDREWTDFDIELRLKAKQLFMTVEEAFRAIKQKQKIDQTQNELYRKNEETETEISNTLREETSTIKTVNQTTDKTVNQTSSNRGGARDGAGRKEGYSHTEDTRNKISGALKSNQNAKKM